MAFQRSFSAFLLIILFCQTIFLGSGLLGICAEDASKICTCNHGSKKEKHAHPDDQKFKIPKKTKLISKSSNNETEILPNCHSAESGEKHICACKKKKSSLARLSIYHQVWKSEVPNSLVQIVLNKENISLKVNAHIQNGWGLLLIKPPKSLAV